MASARMWKTRLRCAWRVVDAQYFHNPKRTCDCQRVLNTETVCDWLNVDHCAHGFYGIEILDDRGLLDAVYELAKRRDG